MVGSGALAPGGDDRRADDRPRGVLQRGQGIVEVSGAGSFPLDVIAHPFDAQPRNQPGAATWPVVAVRAARHLAQAGPLQISYQVPAVTRVPASGSRRPLPWPGDRREDLVRRFGIAPQAIAVFE